MRCILIWLIVATLLWMLRMESDIFVGFTILRIFALRQIAVVSLLGIALVWIVGTIVRLPLERSWVLEKLLVHESYSSRCTGPNTYWHRRMPSSWDLPSYVFGRLLPIVSQSGIHFQTM